MGDGPEPIEAQAFAARRACGWQHSLCWFYFNFCKITNWLHYCQDCYAGRDNGNTCVWQALFGAARSMSQTLTAV